MKIFGIGLERTATTSLVAAMQRLGFSATHFPASILEIERDDFVDDITVAYRFKRLDFLFPGSKFILTTREEAAWLDSCARWHGPRGDAPMPAGASVGFEALLALYGQTTFDPDVWLAGRRRYHQRVFDYFAARPDDLLLLDICGGEGWEILMPFLARAGALGPFPRENVFPIPPAPPAA